MGIETYFTTAAGNDHAGALMPENQTRSSVNNGVRQIQADVRTFYNDPSWIQYGDGNGAATIAYASATSFTVAGADVTAAYHAGRRVKATGSSTGTIYGRITSSSFATDTTVNVVWDSGSLQNEALTIWISALTATNSAIPGTLAFNGFYNITDYGALIDGVTDDQAAWQAAIDAASAAGGGIVFHPGGVSVAASDITMKNGVRIEGIYGQTSSLGSVIKLTTNSSIMMGGVAGGDLRDLRIESDSVNNPAIDFTNATSTASYCDLSRLNVVGGSQCVTFHNCLEIRVARSRFVTIAGATNAVNFDGTEGGVASDSGVDSVEFERCVFGSAGEATADVLDLNGDVASIKFTQCVVLFGRKGMNIRKVGGSTTRSPRFIYFSTGGFENCEGATVDISAGTQIKFSTFYASNDAAAAVLGDNFRLGSGGDVILAAGEIRGAARDGVRVFNGTNATITGCHIGNNGRAETGHGVTITGAGKVVVAGNNIGGFSDGSNAQVYGVQITAQTTPVTVADNDLGDNVTGGLNGFASAPDGSVIRNNRGFVTENWGTAIDSPDGDGNFNIAHGLALTPNYVNVQIKGDTAVDADVEDAGATNIVIRLKNTTTNADITTGPRTVYWEARL